jgi:two-component system, NtrC family, sensor histidine kinase HydH
MTSDANTDSLAPRATAEPVPGAAERGRERWWGLAAGLLVGLADTIMTSALGVKFDLGGRDVTVIGLSFYAVNFALVGYLFGVVLEGRRRDRQAAALIQSQMEAINAARTRLAQSEKLAALGQLAAAIAHEVRNPLAVIRSAAQAVAEALPAGEPESRRACSFITAEIDRLTSVVSSLLAFARPLRLEPRAVTLDGLFDRALLLARDELAAKQVRVRRSEPASLPAVRADADLISQVLLGLLANAAEAVPVGGEVVLGGRAIEESVAIDVADSGPGIPAELRGRIFEPFFTTRPQGTGLGLAVARQIVEAHGGRIEVGDSPTGGARFSILLPAAGAAVLAA